MPFSIEVLLISARNGHNLDSGGRCIRLQEEDGETHIGLNRFGQWEQLATPSASRVVATSALGRSRTGSRDFTNFGRSVLFARFLPLAAGLRHTTVCTRDERAKTAGIASKPYVNRARETHVRFKTEGQTSKFTARRRVAIRVSPEIQPGQLEPGPAHLRRLSNRPRRAF